jgi:gluconate 2-dehydrogenase gamma chain
MSDRVSRKDFVALVGTATAAAAVAAGPADAAPAVPEPSPAPPAHAPHATHHTPPMSMPSAPLDVEPEAYAFFTMPEAAFIEAAVERLIPTDANGPGAKAAGVAYFIDQQLNGVFGAGGNTYRNGPWGHGTPQQGYQLRQTPAELYRQSIGAIDAYCVTTYRKPFEKLASAQQDAVLQGIDTGTIAIADAPAKAFFELLLQNTIEGYFADPMYGGNRDKVGWKLIGFPGVAAYYKPLIDKWNVPYRVEPMSIADVQQGKPAAAGHMLMHHLAMENAAKLRGEKP